MAKLLLVLFVFLNSNLLLAEGNTFSEKILSAQVKHSASNQSCLSCHTQLEFHSQFESSTHKDLNCTACHSPANEHAMKTANSKSAVCKFEFKPISCQRCHENEGIKHKNSVHNSERLPVQCFDCHSDIHRLQSLEKNKIKIAETCLNCHSQQESYLKSSHHLALLKGSKDAPSCVDCHGTHDVNSVSAKGASKLIHTETCLKCHDDKELMHKNKVTTVAAETYFNSYHGKNVKLGFPDKVAGCSDCHNSHMILKAEDKDSSVHKDNLVNTCQQCHKNANSLFVQFAAHGDDQDKEKFSVLYWTRVLMTGLLVGTFLFFWLHSILWANRAYFERKEKKKLLAEDSEAGQKLREKYMQHLMHGQKKYKRFETYHIVLHLVVVTSFLTLALTGLPLKFSGTLWGQSIMKFIGGSDVASKIHHAAAVVTFSYFLVALFLSFKFLIREKKPSESIVSRLLHPDSLFPTVKDGKDILAMFKWFLFLGNKPKFDRWTYWEKFDFLAVFWGMFAIGISGLLLWFPVFFAKFVPGWIFNVATIIHSDEALLATGFIFTVHFFNTHFRPDKFPMDMVIFNGELTEEELKEERPEQYERLLATGEIEKIEVKAEKSQIWNLSFRIFGFIAVAIGIMLFLFMAWTHFTH